MECLRPAATTSPTLRFEQEPPDYERYGERRVKEGRYVDIIRYRDHVRPVAAAIAAITKSKQLRQDQPVLEAVTDETTTTSVSALNREGRPSSHLTSS